MQELEKALKELNCGKVAFEILGRDVDFVSLDWADEVIRKHTPASWIPVEERLPGNGETALCTDGHSIYLVEYKADSDAAVGDIDGITAWMPLPEPYRAEESDGEEGDEFGLQKENHREA